MADELYDLLGHWDNGPSRYIEKSITGARVLEILRDQMEGDEPDSWEVVPAESV